MVMKKIIFILIALLSGLQGASADNIAQAIWCSGNNTLYFDYCETVGGTYNGQAVTKVFNVPTNKYADFYPGWSEVRFDAKTVEFKEAFSKFKPLSCYGWFFQFSILTAINGLTNLNTSEVTNMDFMFDGCSKIKVLDVSAFDVSKVTTAVSMFFNCYSLTTIYSNQPWSIANTESMFHGAAILTGSNTSPSLTDGSMATPQEGYFTIKLSLNDNADNEASLKTWNGYICDMTLNGRTLYKDNSWNMLCLPFDLTIEGSLLDGATVKVFDPTTVLDGPTLTLKFKDPGTTIATGTPFIVKWASGQNIVNPTFAGVVINNSKPVIQSNSENSVLFVGHFSPVEINDANIKEILYVGSNRKMGYPNAAQTLSGFCAYFNILAVDGAKAVRSIVFDKNATFDLDIGSLVVGQGTADNPYLIGKSAELQWMADQYNATNPAVADAMKGKYFKQDANIEFDKTVVNNFTPVKTFRGYYDGAGHTISGLNLNMKDDVNNASLFGTMEDNSSVKNLIVAASSFKGLNAAPIAGFTNSTASIENCHTLKDVSVEGTQFNAGGIVANAYDNSTVKQCTSHATVQGGFYGGGIVGNATGGNIAECIYLGNSIKAKHGSKAVLGVYSSSDERKLKDCYFTASTVSDSRAKLMPSALLDDDNTNFLNLLHHRDELLLAAGLTKEQIAYDLTINGREYKATQQADGTWKRWAYSICLPFDMDIAKLENANDIKVYTLVGVDAVNKELRFTNEFPILKAGEPYMIVVEKEALTFSAKNVLVAAAPIKPRIVKNYDGTKEMGWWRGTFEKVENEQLKDEKAYILQSDGTFKLVEKVYNVRPYVKQFLGYFSAIEPIGSAYKVKFFQTVNGEETKEQTDFPADEFDSDFDLDIETGIGHVAIDKGGEDAYYDLEGRKLNGKPGKGLYIYKGKKINR